MYFSKNLTFLRKSKKCNITDLSSEIGFSRSQWSNYESGASYPKFLDLIKIAKYFDVPENKLVHIDLENFKESDNTIKGSEQIEDLRYTIGLQQKMIDQLEKENTLLKKEIESSSGYHIAAEPTPQLKTNK